MSFVSFEFIVLFLPCLFTIYWAFRKYLKIQNFILFCANIFFYSCFGIKYIGFLTLSIIITFLGALLGTRFNKSLILAALIANILLLVSVKYMGFIWENICKAANIFNWIESPPQIKTISVIGLSFYIFQSSSYLLDVYWDKLEAEKNFVDYALFVSFFGTISSGPIQKAKFFLPQIKRERLVDDYKIQKAILYFLWGASLKMIVADRLAMFTDTVWNSYTSYAGFTLVIAALAYSVQIYLDFSGYSYMAIGVASLFGFTIEENFRQPYLSLTINDFWERWHISLTSWFKEYLYIPLGGNRKGTVRKYTNIILVFLISGLWHGAEWSFVIWGGCHACYRIIGDLTKKWRINLSKMLKFNRNTICYRIWQRCSIFLLTSFAWIFFRATSLQNAFEYIKKLVCWNPWVLFDKSLYSLGLSRDEWLICISGIVLVLIVSCIKEKNKSILEEFHSQNAIFRYFCYAILFTGLLIFGVFGPGYDASTFIYMGF